MDKCGEENKDINKADPCKHKRFEPYFSALSARVWYMTAIYCWVIMTWSHLQKEVMGSSIRWRLPYKNAPNKLHMPNPKNRPSPLFLRLWVCDCVFDSSVNKCLTSRGKCSLFKIKMLLSQVVRNTFFFFFFVNIRWRNFIIKCFISGHPSKSCFAGLLKKRMVLLSAAWFYFISKQLPETVLQLHAWRWK